MRICPFLHQRKKTVSHRITSQGCRMSTWCLFSSNMVYGGGKEAPPSARRSSPRNLFLPGGWWSCKEISVLSVQPFSGAKWLQHETDELVFHSWQAGCPHYMLKGFPLRTADVSKLEESEQKLPRSRCTRSLGCLKRNGSKLTSGEHQPSRGPRGIQSGDLCPATLQVAPSPSESIDSAWLCFEDSYSQCFPSQAHRQGAKIVKVRICFWTTDKVGLLDRVSHPLRASPPLHTIHVDRLKHRNVKNWLEMAVLERDLEIKSMGRGYPRGQVAITHTSPQVSTWLPLHLQP